MSTLIAAIAEGGRERGVSMTRLLITTTSTVVEIMQKLMVYQSLCSKHFT